MLREQMSSFRKSHSVHAIGAWLVQKGRARLYLEMAAWSGKGLPRAIAIWTGSAPNCLGL